jgi:hypothetical protein
MMMENLVERRLAGETDEVGDNPSQDHFVHQKSHLTRPGLEPGPPLWEASDYGAAHLDVYYWDVKNFIISSC